MVQAQVGGASRQITVAYQDRATTDALQLYSIDPRRGSYSGGDQAVIAGKGIKAPIEVYFDLNGVGLPGDRGGRRREHPGERGRLRSR